MMLLAMKSQINNQKTRASPTQHEAGMLCLGPFWTMVAGSCSSVNSCTAASAIEILTLDPIVPNKQHSLEEHFWHVATTPTKRGTRATSRLARLGWLPGQATLLVHGGHEVSNQWEKFNLPQQKPKPLEPEFPRSGDLARQNPSLFFPLSTISIYELQTPGLISITGSQMVSLGLKMHWSKSVKPFGCNRRS